MAGVREQQGQVNIVNVAFRADCWFNSTPLPETNSLLNGGRQELKREGHVAFKADCICYLPTPMKGKYVACTVAQLMQTAKRWSFRIVYRKHRTQGLAG
jgi:hypothetical protein